MTPEALGLVVERGGWVGLLALVAWFIFRDHRRDTGTLDAQADQTAIALLQEQRADRFAMREEMNQLRERLAVMEDRERNQAGVLQIHAAWDLAVIEALNRLDPTLDLGDAPPLYPPHYIRERTPR